MRFGWILLQLAWCLASPGNSLPQVGLLQPPSSNFPQGNANPPNLNLNPPPPPATTPPVSPEGSLPTIEAIQARQQQLPGILEIDPSLKQTLSQLYEAILVELRAKAESERLIKELAASAEAAPTATQDSKRRKENPTIIEFSLSDRLGLHRVEELQREMQSMQSRLQSVQDQRTRVDAAITTRESRRKELPRLLNEDKEQLKKYNDELALPPAVESDPRLTEAKNILLLAKRETLLERSRKMEAELRTYDAESELLPLRKELLAAEEKQYQARLKELADELNKRRESFIQTEKNKIERLAASSLTKNRATADRLVKRVNDWLDLAKNNAAIQLEIESAKSQRTLWSERFKIMSERIEPQSAKEVGSFNSLVGLMLRRQRSELPDPSKLQSQLREYETKMMQAETLILELDDWKAQQTALEQGDPVALGFNATNGASGPTSNPSDNSQDENGSLLSEYSKLLAAEKELVANFRVDASNYFDNLFALAGSKRDMINLVRDYRAFVDQHVLWIRSSDRFDKGEFLTAWPALQWLFSGSQWKQVGELLYQDAFDQPWWAIGTSILLLLLAYHLTGMRRRILKLGEQAERSNNTTFLPTARTILLSLLVSLPVVIILGFFGSRLLQLADPTSFAGAFGFGCLAATRYFFSLEILRQFHRPGGLVQKHFQWPESATAIVRNNLRWLIDLGIPLVAIVAILSRTGEEKWESSLGRLAFCLLMILCGIFLVRILRPSRGVFTEYLEQNREGWADRLRYFWYLALASGPWLLLAISLFGYHYTALRLAMLLHTSAITLVCLLLLHSLLRRWFLLSRKKIVISQARQRLEDAQKREPGSSPASHATPGQIDLAEINAQTMRLVSSMIVLSACGAVAYIWSGVLPAVSAFNAIELWRVTGATPDKTIPISLANVLFAIPLLAMTIVAARNLPGLMEIALLQHLPLENAVRYAIATLSRYAIFVLGIAVTFNSIGVRWSSIQWLVAALGVGLGFGLQEIFANFISGLILLFEQPIRVGDVITLGETTGSVARIRMRATTIVNWDRQELIIPNKDLVTGRLLNWTLTDSTNRLKLQIGVAYGSDPDLACRILTDICLNHPNVLKDPLPSAHFECFGDSALLLNCRIFLANLELRLQTRHEILTEISRSFAQAGIEIPFPQRDLHVRSLPSVLTKFLARG